MDFNTEIMKHYAPLWLNIPITDNNRKIFKIPDGYDNGGSHCTFYNQTFQIKDTTIQDTQGRRMAIRKYRLEHGI